MSESLGLGKCECLASKEKYYISGTVHNEIEKIKEEIERMKSGKMIPKSSIDVYEKINNELRTIKQKVDNTPVCK